MPAHLICTLVCHEPAERPVGGTRRAPRAPAARIGRSRRKAPLNLTQRVAVATIVQGVGKAVALIFSLLSIRLATNYLGVNGFGDYAIVMTISALVLVSAELGLGVMLARELAKHPGRADDIASTVLFLRLVSVTAVMALSFVIVPFLPYTAIVREGLLIAIAGSLVGLVAYLPNSFFQVHLRLERAALAEVIMRLTALSLMVVVVALDWGFLAFVACTAVAWAFSLGMSFYLLRPFWRAHVRVRWGDVRRVAIRAVPVGLVALLGLLHFKVDAVMLSLLKPSSDVGIYAIAYSVIEQALVLPTLLIAAVFPILSRFIAEGNQSVGDVVEKTFRLLVVAGIAVAGALFILAGPIVHVLSNESFDDAVVVLRILAFAVIPLFATVIFANLLVSLETLRLVVAASAFGVVVNILLNLYLIPAYSYNGAAASTVFSEALGFVLIASAARSAYPSMPIGIHTLLRVFGAVAASTATLIATVDSPLWLASLAFAITFVCAVVGLRLLSASDLRLVLQRTAGRL